MMATRRMTGPRFTGARRGSTGLGATARALAAFLAVLVLVAGCAPPPAASSSQAPASLPRVGVRTFEGGAWNDWVQAFRDGLRELGYVDGQNVVIEEVTSPDNSLEALQAAVAKLREDKVDVIVTTVGPQQMLDVSQAAGSTPVIETLMFSTAVGAEPIASMARPGGNLSGIIITTPEQYARRVQILKEVAPGTARIIVLTPWDRPVELPSWPEMQEMARTLGIAIERVQPTGPEDLVPALEAAVQRGGDALLQYQGTPFANQELRQRVVDFALQRRLPSIYVDGSWARLGGLIAYAPNTTANWKRAAAYVDKILKGTRVADLPVEQPARFDIIINLIVAQALGLTVPQPVLAQASELIQ